MISDDLVRYADLIRLTYLTIRDGLYAPPLLANTDGDPLEFHTLRFRIESAQKAFDALAPLAFGRSRKDLLEDAKFGKDGRLQRIEFDWRRRGNAKIRSWDNTILGNIKISHHSLIAEVNSESRAGRFRAEVERRLGASATRQGTSTKTVEEMLARTPKRIRAQAKQDDELEQTLLHDPDARDHLRQIIQGQVQDWVHHKVPALGGRTPLQAVQDPDGREIVESLLLDWERRGIYQAGIRPDFNAVRRLLNLPTTTMPEA